MKQEGRFRKCVTGSSLLVALALIIACSVIFSGIATFAFKDNDKTSKGGTDSQRDVHANNSTIIVVNCCCPNPGNGDGGDDNGGDDSSGVSGRVWEKIFEYNFSSYTPDTEYDAKITTTSEPDESSELKDGNVTTSISYVSMRNFEAKSFAIINDREVPVEITLTTDKSQSNPNLVRLALNATWDSNGTAQSITLVKNGVYKQTTITWVIKPGDAIRVLWSGMGKDSTAGKFILKEKYRWLEE